MALKEDSVLRRHPFVQEFSPKWMKMHCLEFYMHSVHRALFDRQLIEQYILYLYLFDQLIFFFIICFWKFIYFNFVLLDFFHYLKIKILLIKLNSVWTYSQRRYFLQTFIIKTLLAVDAWKQRSTMLCNNKSEISPFQTYKIFQNLDYRIYFTSFAGNLEVFNNVSSLTLNTL